MRLKLLIPLLILASTPVWVAAQGLGMSERALELNLYPSTPEPQEEYRASLGVIDIGSEILWFINGEEVISNRNQRNISLTAPASGDSQLIRAETINPSGIRNNTSIEVVPRYLDIILEPQTYVPDFYLGRSLPSIGSQVNATALVSGTDIPTSNLVYRWEVDGIVLLGGAGRGQNRVSFEMPLLRNPLLRLEVTDLQGNLISAKNMTIKTSRPSVTFYGKSPLFGINHNPFVDQALLVGSTNLIEAVPYHLDSRVYNRPDVAEWSLGRQVYDDLAGNPYEITLESGQESSLVELEFDVRSTSVRLQRAQGSVDLRI